MRTKHLRRVLR